MANIIAFSNQKGGVGKTTSAVNTAASLGNLGKKVLLVDFDPQGNATSGVGISKKSVVNSVYDLVIGRCSAKEAIIDTRFKNLSVIPSHISLAGAEFELVDENNRESKLREALNTVSDDYDYIIIDCPPSLGLLSINALAASTGVIIPMQCEYFALEGLSQLLLTIKQVKKLYNPELDITGIMITMYNGRLNLTLQVMDELKKYYADKIFRTTIARNVKLSEAPSYGEPILYYDKYSKGGLAYTEIAKEIIERIG
ncbi:MAG: ParA family protein [Oscillospiraceae bacterium]|nr:ParA family protein [Oscillospiraceae bacterium]